MFGIGGSVRIYYCPTPINLRKSFDGLAGAVEEYIKQDPESGHVFAFFSRNKKLVKLLQWEDGGFVIWMKRLEQGGFPRGACGCSETVSTLKKVGDYRKMLIPLRCSEIVSK